MKVLDNKCPACGAKITFNPLNQKWDCEYCGSKYSLEEMEKYTNASSKKANKKEETIGKIDSYNCQNCGAEIIADENTTATFCVYCGSTAILKNKIDGGRVPDLIIPFKKVKEDAINAFINVTKHKPLMPKCFRNKNNIEKITGVYIPFWAYDVNVDGEINYVGIDTRHWSDSRYYYTETRTFDVVRSGHFEYEKILADASSRFDDDLMDSVEPFNFDELTEYNHAYFSGFFAEKYDVLEDAGFERAKFRTKKTCEQLLGNEIHHQSHSVKMNNTICDKVKDYYIMLPVYMLNIKYNNKDYMFAMNGQTGKIVGNIPIDYKKVVIWSISLFIIFFILTFIVSMWI